MNYCRSGKLCILIENDTHRWVVDSKTFELPEEEPWIEDEDEDEDEDEGEDEDDD